MEEGELKRVIEALLFASERPLSIEELKQAFSSEGKDEEGRGGEIQKILEVLRQDYEAERRGFKLLEIAGGWQLVTDPRFSPYLKRFFQAREKKRVSSASLETLAVVAYKQPVTRADIEFIRGVNVEGALRTLLEKKMVRIVGRKDVPGRPILYGTTRDFLEYFGLKSLQDLPPLSEFTLKDIEEHLLPPELKAARAAGEDFEPSETGPREDTGETPFKTERPNQENEDGAL